VIDWQADDEWYELLPWSVGQSKHIRVQQSMTSSDDKENGGKYATFIVVCVSYETSKNSTKHLQNIVSYQ